MLKYVGSKGSTMLKYVGFKVSTMLYKYVGKMEDNLINLIQLMDPE